MAEPIYTRSMIELMGKGEDLFKFCHIPLKLEVYPDYIKLKIRSEDYQTDERFETELVIPYSKGDRLLPISVRGENFFWDLADEAFRWIPQKEITASVNINPWISYHSNRELRIKKKYAECNLSKTVLEYAFFSNDEYYSWNTADFSYAPILFEIPAVFKDSEYFGHLIDRITVCNLVATFATTYAQSTNVSDVEDIAALYYSNFKRKIIQPEN